uniref:Crumbs cell polarity complex component 3 n=1 Tax=Aquila chrysaetos chrysaetos TaxID=223781 RepID=A0A663FGC8_AQUCH
MGGPDSWVTFLGGVGQILGGGFGVTPDTWVPPPGGAGPVSGAGTGWGRDSTLGVSTVALTVVLGGLGAFGLVGLLLFLALRLREKRRTEGSYRPSREEQAGARAPPPAPLRLPPEERLI